MKERLEPYIRALPDIFNYQIVTKVVLGVWLFLLGRLFQLLLKSSGRVAVTTGDWQFLFTTWQGILILLLGIVSLFIYVAFDLNAKILLCRDIVTGRKVKLREDFSEGFRSIGRMLSVRGLLVVLYIALIAPLLGIGLSITATENLYIPTFISSFIEDSTLLSILGGAALLLFLCLGIANLFVMHGIVLDKLKTGDASKQSIALMKANWKDYVKQNVLFLITLVVLITATAVVLLFLPLKIISVLPLSPAASRILTVFFVTAGVILSSLVYLFSTPLYLMKMTQLFFSYKQGSRFEYRMRTRERHTAHKVILAIIAVVAVVCIFFTYFNFDRMFPTESKCKIIAHRAGGNEAAENTIAGLHTAWKAGAYGSEIDIQRTKDGYYVINHDSDFERVAGDNRKPEEMTLREVKKLSVGKEPVPTYEEMLIASKGKLVLFIELKGATADKKMADEATALVKQYQMEKESVIISLKYDLIDYIETNYPEIQTGFLTFASFGKTSKLNCDYIGLEEESATADAIDAIHDEGKKVMVWTANEAGSQRHFLCTKADAIITDNITQAKKLQGELGNRSDLDRMVDKIKTIM